MFILDRQTEVNSGPFTKLAFQQHFAATCNGGASSEACNTRQRIGGYAVYAYGKNSGYRYTPPTSS